MLDRLATESWEDFTERRIRQAQADGSFDNLPGFGQPIPGIDDPPEENWWLKQKLRDEQLSALPPILQARLDRAKFLESLGSISTEVEVRRGLESLNQQIRAAHFSGSDGPAEGVLPVDAESTISRWRELRQQERMR
jgi:hypothetical protein